jgi:hypothetical protein
MSYPPDRDKLEYDLDQLVNASSGDVPHLPHHIRDEERLIAELPACSLRPIACDSADERHLSTYPATLWIPALGTAEVMEVPEPTWNGWEWACDTSLLIHVDRDPHLPRLSNLTAAMPSDSQALVGGRPMRVRPLAPGDPGWAGKEFAGLVLGFLDEATRFWAQAVAPTEVTRDALLAAVLTLTRFLGVP